MNEQDLMIQEKIKKREKTDIMLAYILIVILLGCILFIVYLKFIKKEDNSNVDDNTTEYTVNYIKLDDIASDINNNLNSKYSGINASVIDNSINVKYGDIIYDIKLINNELEFNIDNNNRELSEDIYKEIIASVCTFYSNDRTGCVNATNNVKNDNIDGYRFVNDTIYINITNGVTPVEVVNKTIYSEETIADIDNFDYEINMNDKVISNIKVDMSDVDITIIGDLSSSGNVTVKIYDNDEKLLEEKSTDGEYNFSISFEYNDNLNIDSIKKYSISIE